MGTEGTRYILKQREDTEKKELRQALKKTTWQSQHEFLVPRSQHISYNVCEHMYCPRSQHISYDV